MQVRILCRTHRTHRCVPLMRVVRASNRRLYQPNLCVMCARFRAAGHRRLRMAGRELHPRGRALHLGAQGPRDGGDRDVRVSTPTVVRQVNCHSSLLCVHIGQGRFPAQDVIEWKTLRFSRSQRRHVRSTTPSGAYLQSHRSRHTINQPLNVCVRVCCRRFSSRALFGWRPIKIREDQGPTSRAAEVAVFLHSSTVERGVVVEGCNRYVWEPIVRCCC